MKFRGKITDINIFNTMKNLVNVFAKQHRELIIKLDNSNMYFICKELREGVQILAKLPACYMFTEYQFEGVSKESDQIFLLLETEKFLRTLKQNNNQTKAVKLKLIQKGYSSFVEIIFEQLPNIGNEPICINHDVPIELLSRKDWSFFEELDVIEAEDIFYLPPLKHIRNAIDKQKNFDKYINIILQNNSLVIKVKNLLCQVSTFYPNIEFKGEYSVQESQSFKEIEVDSKRLAAFLTSLNLISTIKIEVNLIDKHLISFSYIQDHIFVKFTIPHQYSND